MWGGIWVSPTQVSGGIGTMQSRAFGFYSTTQDIPSKSNNKMQPICKLRTFGSRFM